MQENQAPSFDQLVNEVAFNLDLHTANKSEPELAMRPSEIYQVGNSTEPTDIDLAAIEFDLDKLLADSMALKPAYKRPSRKLLEELRESNTQPMTVWTVLETVALWEQTTCLCGEHGPATFCHFMQKQVGSGITQWKRVDVNDETKPLRHALKKRLTRMCELCMEVEPTEMEDIAHALR